jgi:hypothetical protein
MNKNRTASVIIKLTEGDKDLKEAWNQAISAAMVQLPFKDKITRAKINKLYR